MTKKCGKLPLYTNGLKLGVEKHRKAFYVKNHSVNEMETLKHINKLIAEGFEPQRLDEFVISKSSAIATKWSNYIQSKEKANLQDIKDFISYSLMKPVSQAMRKVRSTMKGIIVLLGKSVKSDESGDTYTMADIQKQMKLFYKKEKVIPKKIKAYILTATGKTIVQYEEINNMIQQVVEGADALDVICEMHNKPKVIKSTNNGKTFYNVMIWSPKVKKYIAQGEWATKAQADKDLKNFQVYESSNELGLAILMSKVKGYTKYNKHTEARLAIAEYTDAEECINIYQGIIKRSKKSLSPVDSALRNSEDKKLLTHLKSTMGLQKAKKIWAIL